MLKVGLSFLCSLVLACTLSGQADTLISFLEVYDLATHQRKVVHQENGHLEAPNWSPDNQHFLVNGGGRLFRIPRQGGEKTEVFTGFADKCNNDHGFTPDGNNIIISHYDEPGVRHGEHNFRTSRIYTLPASGGVPTVVTPQAPSFWHGVSPDGSTLVYVGLRDGEFDLYSIPITGGAETRLTDAPGLQDGPDYSPDGKFIYYNSFQSGSMEIWRMNADGSAPEQLTNDHYSNWFPHPSPDGKGFVFLTYLDDQGDRHPAMQRVALRYYDLTTREITWLTYFTGGQGTINVPSWSPDGSAFAFVSYRAVSTPEKSNVFLLRDGDMPATAYVDGRLNARDTTRGDDLTTFSLRGEELIRTGSAAVTNSVRRWPNSADLLRTKDRRFLLIAEQDGKAKPGAYRLGQLARGEVLSMVDVTDAEQPRRLSELKFANIPAAVAVHPHEPVFALTFLGTDSIALGTVIDTALVITQWSKIELPGGERIPAIPHFTWHPSGKFAAITLAGNDKVAFLRYAPRKVPALTLWGNTLRTAPLPGVGYFSGSGRHFLFTTIGLTGDEAQSAYADHESLLTVVRFDPTEQPDSPPTRSNDGQLTYQSPPVKHVKTGQYGFGQGYVETFAISPDAEYVVGLNMRSSWLPEDRMEAPASSRLEIFSFDDQHGKASRLNAVDFPGVLPECIVFTPSGRKMLSVSFDHSGAKVGQSSLDLWSFDPSGAPAVRLLHRKYLARGAHFLLLD